MAGFLGSASIAKAHGFNNDGHLGAMDYIQVIGIGVISLGLLAYSFDKWRKDRKNSQK